MRNQQANKNGSDNLLNRSLVSIRIALVSVFNLPEIILTFQAKRDKQ